jgi:enoyl-CoA hydratase/carnithine racemase
MVDELQPPRTSFCDLTYPAKGVVQVTLNRPKQLNCITHQGHRELDAVWQWFDRTPELMVAIFTGSGRAFSGGADLREWMTLSPDERGKTPSNGFGGLSLRRGLKPVIAALNGFSIGGATEMVINCDMVVASPKAYLGLPDVKVGLTGKNLLAMISSEISTNYTQQLLGFGGTFPRLVRRIGRSRATDMCLTGRNISAEEAFRWGLVDRVADEGQDIVQVALHLATQIAANSPDAIIATRDGMLAGEDALDSIEAGKNFIRKWVYIVNGDNCQEGIRAFNERRPPVWRPTKL